jgi:hypothetical protein
MIQSALRRSVAKGRVRDTEGRTVAVSVDVVQGGPSGIVFRSNGDGGDVDIFRRDAGRGTVTALTANEDDATASPASLRIAAGDDILVSDCRVLHAMNADGTNPQTVLADDLGGVGLARQRRNRVRLGSGG